MRTVLTDAGVRITGWMTGSALAAELGGASVYFHSANYEGFPLSVLDAAALDRPVVARRIDALADSPLHTFVGESRCSAAVLRAIEDPTFRSELKAAGRSLLAEMNADSMGSALDELYNSVASRRRVASALPDAG